MDKDFNENKHITCPECGFEVVYLNNNYSSYIYNNGDIDEDTERLEDEAIQGELIQCNHINCDWSIEV